MRARDQNSPSTASRRASEHALSLIRDLKPGCLLAYVPTRSEIDPILLLIAAIELKWTVAVPNCTNRGHLPQIQALPEDAFALGSKGAGDSAPSWNLAAFKEDAWGMLAPIANVPVRAASISVALVPGLAFDNQGHRLGRGAGIYDRLLASLPAGVFRIGCVEANRMVPELPREAHDVPMNAVVTPEGILRVSR